MTKIKIIKYILITCFINFVLICLIYLLVGAIKRHPSVILREDSEYMYVKKYSLYNKDSCVYKYHKPIIHEGIVVDKTTRFTGVPGKGRHKVYRTYIKYGNTEYLETGFDSYNKYNKGDKVKLKETFYPYYNIEIIK